MRAGIEHDIGSDIEQHTFERGIKGFKGCRQPEAIGIDRAFEHQRQPARALFQIGQGLLVGLAGIGVVDAGQRSPWRARCAADQRRQVRAFGIKRLDADRIGGMPDQFLVEICAFEHGFDPRQPDVTACQCSVGDKRMISHQGSLDQFTASRSCLPMRGEPVGWIGLSSVFNISPRSCTNWPLLTTKPLGE